VDPEVPVRLKHFTNVEFVVGPSQDTLPLLMKRIQDQQVPLNFILVDGDHSTDGVRSDCNQLLSYRPIVDLVVLMHDSFNPQVREGIRTAAWNESPYVHTVDIDFIPGTAHSRGAFGFELWGGFGLALLRPEKAPEPVSVKRSSDRTYRKLVWQSRHFPLFGWPYRVGSRLARLFVGGKGALV
jgi:hypothetical protein